MKKRFYLFLLALLSVTEIMAQCPTMITVTPQNGCGIYQLHLNEFADNGNIIWTYDGGLPLSGGSNNVTWGTDTPGIHTVCAQAWTSFCPNSITICVDIEVPICPAFSCPVAINASPIDCNSFEFSVTGVDAGTVVWTYGDGDMEDIGITADHSYLENNSYLVTALYYGEYCQEGTLISTLIEVNCESVNDCPVEISQSPGDACGVMNFEIGSFVEGESVTWYPGDETSAAEGGHFFSHTYANPGPYNVCAFYTSPACPDGVELCVEITVAPCNTDECPSVISVQQIDCDSYVFHVEGVQNGYAIWTFGDDTGETSEFGVDHTYNANGLNIVTAHYFSPSCPDGVTLIYTVNVECVIEPSCPTEISFGVGDACGVMNFEIGSFVAGESVTWFPNDDTGPVEGGHFFTHTYTTSGAHSLCAFYTSPACPDGVELCVDFMVAPCNTDECPTNISAQQIDCDSYVFHIMGGESGYAIWSFGDESGETSQSDVDHTFGEDNIYIVTAQYFSPNCQEGITLMYTVLVDCIEQPNCPTEIWHGAGAGCGVMNFEIGDFQEGQEVTWYPGDETGAVEGGHFFTHTYEVPGTYLVCAFYTSPMCPEGVELCTEFEVSPCDTEICPTEITITPLNCHQYVFAVNEWGNSLYGDILWSFGDTEGYGQNEFLHMYLEPGMQNVCVSGTTDACPSGFEICTTLHVEACGGDSGDDGCPDWIWGMPLNECGLWHFEAGQFESNSQTATWHWGDETSSTGSTIMNHQYEVEGTYIVTLTYFSEECGGTVTINYTLQANVCEIPDCPQEISFSAGADCGVINFEAGSFVEGESFIWYFGDGTSQEGGHAISHQYDAPDTYQVSCVLSNANCQGWQLTISIVVEPCDEPCNEVTLGINSYVSNGGTSSLYYSIHNAETSEMLYFGEANYTEQDPHFDVPMCLPDGCYTLMVDNNNMIQLDGNIFLHMNVNDQNVMENALIIYQDNISFTVQFGINSDCSIAPNCAASFEPIVTNTPGHIEFSNTSTYSGSASFIWEYGNDTSSDGQSGNVWYEENGIYEVCLTVTTADCQDTYCHPVSIQNLEVACTENLVTVNIEAEYSSNITELVAIALSYQGFEIETWSLPMTSGFSVSLTACVPTGCYELDLSTELPTTADFIIAEITMNGETLSVLEFLNNNSSSSVVFGVNSDCTIGIEESNVQNWSIYPNPANSELNVRSSDGSAINQIELFDAMGQLVSSHRPSYTNNFYMDITELSNGIYSLKISSADSFIISRFEVIK